MKMHRVRDKQRHNKTAADTGAAAPSMPTGATNEEADQADKAVVAKPDGVSRQTLERYLAAEAAEREASEGRTSRTLARYFKVSLVMAGLNMVVAAVSVSLLFSHSDKMQTTAVALPPAQPSSPVLSPAPAASVPAPAAPVLAPAVSVPAAAKTPVTAAPASTRPTTTTSVTPAAVPAKPAKIQLLGESPSPIRKRPSTKPPARALRLVSRPAPAVTPPSEPMPSLVPSLPRSVVLAKSPDEEYAATQMAERW